MIIDVHKNDNQVVPGGGQPWSLQAFGCGHKGSKITLPVDLINSEAGRLAFLIMMLINDHEKTLPKNDPEMTQFDDNRRHKYEQ